MVNRTRNLAQRIKPSRRLGACGRVLCLYAAFFILRSEAPAATAAPPTMTMT